MIDAKHIGLRLRIARERRGLNQDAVASRLGLPRTAVSKMEHGVRSVSSRELMRLAELYCCSAWFFFEDDKVAEGDSLAVVLHRALPEMKSNPEVDDAVWKMIDLCQEGVMLRDRLGRASAASIPQYNQDVSTFAEAIQQGEDVAERERERLDLENAPIRDIAACIRDQGIWITAMESLPDGVSGFFIDYPDFGPAIFVNRKHSVPRQCFSYAHEYAHALFDRADIPTVSRKENASSLIEKRANAFAAAFLMPRQGVHDLMASQGKSPSYQQVSAIYDLANDTGSEVTISKNKQRHDIAVPEIASLAVFFGVSFDAAIWRLRGLHYFDHSEAVRFSRQRSTGRRHMQNLRSDDDHMDSIKPSNHSNHDIRVQVLQMAIEAYCQALISIGRLVEIGKKLDVDRETLLERIDARTLPNPS